MDPLISVIIPVYNHEQALRRALVSIERQAYRPIEVIVVDDGSEPKLVSPPIRGSQRGSLVNQTQDSSIDPSQPPLVGEEVKVFHQEHAGAPAARNRGFRESKGEYVIFWDADVIANHDMLSIMKKALDYNPSASFAYSNFRFGFKKMPAQAFEPARLKEKNFIHSTSLIRRSAVIPWDESLKRFQDWDLWLTMAEQGKRGIWIDEYLFHVEPRKQGISAWLPSFAYKNPWRLLPGIRGRVNRYEEAREVIKKKHHLSH